MKRIMQYLAYTLVLAGFGAWAAPGESIEIELTATCLRPRYVLGGGGFVNSCRTVDDDGNRTDCDELADAEAEYTLAESYPLSRDQWTVKFRFLNVGERDIDIGPSVYAICGFAQ